MYIHFSFIEPKKGTRTNRVMGRKGTRTNRLVIERTPRTNREVGKREKRDRSYVMMQRRMKMYEKVTQTYRQG